MTATSNVCRPDATMRPVIVLDTPSHGIGLRASFDQRGTLYLALVHVESDTALTVSAHMSGHVRPAALEAIQAGSVVYLLAKGEADRFFSWLRSGMVHPGGVH